MQFNITTDYAIRTVLYLAIRNEIVTSKEIAESMGIPLYYLFKITAKLVKVGILQRFQGVNGGFMLQKTPEQITLYDIIEALESTTKINRCLEEDKYCSRFATDNCPVRNFYVKTQNEIEDKLKSVTIEKLLKQ